MDTRTNSTNIIARNAEAQAVGKRVMVAMSGGVDSSVAAAILLEEGYETSGATLKLTNQTSCDINTRGRTCCSLEDIEDARSVALNLDIDYLVLNHTQDFQTQVIDRFVNAYKNGYTPNPCIDCNRYIKFASFFEQADLLGFDYLATGHYARVEYNEATGRHLLKKGKDGHKDQSYVLYSLSQEQLAHTLFPLGEYDKPEIRDIADRLEFVNSKKPDSQDICFVPDGNYRHFLEEEGVVVAEGNFIDKSGKVLGRHKGIEAYTVGQRRGLGIASDQPLFVISKSVEHNTVTLGYEEELYVKGLIAHDINWISIPELTSEIHVGVKIRYSHREVPATVRPLADGRAEVIFNEPQKAVTPGQAAVFYDGDVVVGGGTIIEAIA